MTAQVKDTTTVAIRPAITSSGSYGWFTNSTTVPAHVATLVTADWLNDIQGTFMDLYSRTGITPVQGSGGDRNLYDAVNSMLSPYLNISTANGLYVDIAGDTMTGRLTLSADPVTNLHAATKQYVDTQAGLRVLKAGDSMSGYLTLNGDPISALHSATKQYVDNIGGARVRMGSGSGQSSNVVHIGWSAGSQLRVQVDATDFGSTWPININGSASFATNSTKASTLAQNGSGSGMTFNWSGQAGQPTWLWGGTDGINHYVYNPSNFNVNAANTSIGDFRVGTNGANSFIYFRNGGSYIGFDGGNFVFTNHMYGPGVGGGDTRLAYAQEVTNAYTNAYNNATAWAANPAASYLGTGWGYKRLPGNFMIQWIHLRPGILTNNQVVSWAWPTAFATILSANLSDTAGMQGTDYCSEGATITVYNASGGQVHVAWTATSSTNQHGWPVDSGSTQNGATDEAATLIIWALGTW